MMQMATILWHISLLVPPHRKALALGLVGLGRVGPIVVFGLVSGVMADVMDRRRLMLITQSGMAAIALALAILTLDGRASIWLVYGLAGLSSALSAFDGPARQALLPNLVPRADLPSAISLNVVMFHAASVLGPSLAGVVIATAGVGAVYALNAVSFLAVIASLLLMRGVSARPEGRPGAVSVAAALEGLRFVFASPLIRSSMLLDALATFFSSATALLPIFAQDILDVGPRGYGWLYAAPSMGAVVASVGMLAAVDRIERRGVVLLGAVGVYGLAAAGFGLSRDFGLTLLCLAATGAADTVSGVLRNLIRQLETPDHLRGRMVGVTMIFFMGGPQLGELEAGLVANWFGAPFAVVSGGLACLVATAWIGAATPRLRRYRRGGEGSAPLSA
jgi:MFS family permease